MKTIEHKGIDYYIDSHVNGYTVSWIEQGYRNHIIADTYDGAISFIDRQ